MKLTYLKYSRFPDVEMANGEVHWLDEEQRLTRSRLMAMVQVTRRLHSTSSSEYLKGSPPKGCVMMRSCNRSGIRQHAPIPNTL